MDHCQKLCDSVVTTVSRNGYDPREIKRTSKLRWEECGKIRQHHVRTFGSMVRALTYSAGGPGFDSRSGHNTIINMVKIQKLKYFIRQYLNFYYEFVNKGSFVSLSEKNLKRQNCNRTEVE